MTPGLANKIAIPSAPKSAATFLRRSNLSKGKAVLTGSPIRQELLSGNKIAAMDMCHFTLTNLSSSSSAEVLVL